MLEFLDAEVRECLRRADECAQRAKSETNRIFQRDFVDLEIHWLKLARSYQFCSELRNLGVQYKLQCGELSDRLTRLKHLTGKRETASD
jgi:hypothetical protein